jgi:hypothetical protein
MMVEGVHSGSHGPLLHKAEDLGRFPASWDGIPVMIGHPQIDGVFVSANIPEILEQSVGRIFHTHMEDNKLKAEAWIDEQRITALSPTALSYIQNGRPLDVSIGAFTEEEPTTGVYNENETYIAIARNHRPNHLALLPGERGACGWEDGCGIRNNNLNEVKEEKNDMTDEQILTMKQSFGEGTFTGLTVNEQGYQERMEKLRMLVDSYDNDRAVHYLEEAYDGYFVYRKRIRDASPVVAECYKQAYSIDTEGKIDLSGEPVKVVKNVTYVQVNKMTRTDKKGDLNMDVNLEKPCCLEKVVELINNKLTKYTEADREWLLTLGKEKLELITPVEPEAIVTQLQDLTGYVKKDSLKTEADFLALAPESIQDSLKAGLRLNQEHRSNLIQSIIANSAEGVWTDVELKGQSTEMLEKLNRQFPQANYIGQAAGSALNANSSEVEPMLPADVVTKK